MITVILLSQLRYDYIDYAQLMGDERIRLVAILTTGAKQNFPESVQSYFSRIYEVAKQNRDAEMVQFANDLQLTKDIVGKEVSMAGGAENVRLVCSDESNVSLTGFLRDYFNIPGAGYDEVILFRDKLLMKDKLRDSPIRIPKYTDFNLDAAKRDSASYYEHLVGLLGERFVIKPTDGVASITTSKVFSYQQFQHALMHVNSDMLYEAEEFISGKLFHCDIIVQDKQPVLTFVSEYSCPNLAFLDGKVLASIPLLQSDPLYQRIADFSWQTIQYLSDFDGARHLEVFLTEQEELIFLEVGARVPGVIAVPNYEKMYHVNLQNMQIQLQYQRLQEITTHQIAKPSFWVLFPKHIGRIVKINQPQLNSDSEFTWLIQEGDVINEQTSSVRDCSGFGFVSNDDYEELRQDFEALRDYQGIVVERESES